MRMNARKDNNQQLSMGIYQNRIGRKNLSFRIIDYKQWISRTFIKLVICLIMFLMILVIKNIDTKPTNYIINQVEYRLNKKFEASQNYTKVKNGIAYFTKQGEKALAVINVGNQSKVQFSLPVEGNIVIHFEDIIEGTNRTSKGIVIEGVDGQNILATQEGVILETGYNESSGNYIVIKHKGELLSVYKNIGNSIVEKNQKVIMGEIIGTSTGKLQLEVWNNRQPVDPLLYIGSDKKSM